MIEGVSLITKPLVVKAEYLIQPAEVSPLACPLHRFFIAVNVCVKIYHFKMNKASHFRDKENRLLIPNNVAIFIFVTATTSQSLFFATGPGESSYFSPQWFSSNDQAGVDVILALKADDHHVTGASKHNRQKANTKA